MPQYMLLIYSPTEGGPSQEERAAQMPRWYEYTQGLQDAGVLVAGDALHVPDLDTALDHASRVPNVGYGSIEVRPVLDLSDMPTPAGQAQAQA